MRAWWGVVVVGSILGVPAVALAQDELDRHIEAMRPRLEDPGRDLLERAALALELATTLDRAARSAATAEESRRRWEAAAALLDRFGEKNPGHPRARAFALQAAVYLWARAGTWASQAEADPADADARRHAVEGLDAVIARLRPQEAALGRANDDFARNVRFRLARALADRGALGTEVERRQAATQALNLLDRPLGTGPLAGFAHLLKAELFVVAGEPDRAAEEAETAARNDPPPPAAELLEARINALIGLGRTDEALQFAARSPGSDAAKTLLALRVRLGQYASARDDDRGRREAEKEAFRLAGLLRDGGKSEVRPALIALARTIVEPDPSRPPEAFDLLAEGHLLLGQGRKAAEVEATGADRAEALGQADRARSLRYRAAAMAFKAGELAKADAWLGRLVADKDAGPTRAKASLLRTLARGRLAAKARGESATAAYVAALESHLEDFPDDPGTAEVRWLLGRARLAAGRRDEALALWDAIPRAAPRWLDARLARADLLRDEAGRSWRDGDRELARKDADQARAGLARVSGESRDAAERFAVELARVRLELTPGVGQPRTALETCDHLLESPGRADQRDQARRLRIVALAATERFLDADRLARVEVPKARPEELLDLSRLLDRLAAAADSDLVRRRVGQLDRAVITRVPDAIAPTDHALRDEARLRLARALLFAGDSNASWEALVSWPIDQARLDDALLDDLADLETRLDAFDRAAGSYRLLIRRRNEGSTPWLAARYGLAFAYYRSGRVDEARHLIDGTILLHPELGGAELRDRFRHLRTRLDQH
ncbi:MAG TPA: hypothetical protein VG406_13905 [Isosphaeraceae bacterium]|jgi:tetratricopeptide (TPR) repeat protein|nr:hypothetical protein [Isosphaeraceae bacterium]